MPVEVGAIEEAARVLLLGESVENPEYTRGIVELVSSLTGERLEDTERRLLSRLDERIWAMEITRDPESKWGAGRIVITQDTEFGWWTVVESEGEFDPSDALRPGDTLMFTDAGVRAPMEQQWLTSPETLDREVRLEGSPARIGGWSSPAPRRPLLFLAVYDNKAGQHQFVYAVFPGPWKAQWIKH